MKLLALFAALLPALAGAGEITATAQGPFDPALKGALTFYFESGCVRAGQYERPVVRSDAPQAKLLNTPDAGRCYVVVSAQDSRATLTDRSTEEVFDFGTLEQVPHKPPAPPAATWTPVPPVAVKVTLSNFDDASASPEATLTITGTGTATLALIPPTSFWDQVPLGVNDGKGPNAVTLTGPFSGRVDIDGTQPLVGVDVTVGGVTKQLRGPNWTVSF